MKFDNKAFHAHVRNLTHDEKAVFFAGLDAIGLRAERDIAERELLAAGQQDLESSRWASRLPALYSNHAITAARLLYEISRKPLRRFFQIDAFPNDETFGGYVWELRNCDDPVRVQIPVGTSRDDVLKHLRGVIQWIEGSGLQFADDQTARTASNDTDF